MEPRTEERESRFRFDKLEARIAPGTTACVGLDTALAAAGAATSGTPAPVDFVVDTVGGSNPEAEC